jgi:hypothetical protein
MTDVVSAVQETAHKQAGKRVEEFPLEVFPEALVRFVREHGASKGVPPEMVALPLLVSLGCAIGNSKVIEVKPGDWYESSALYAVTIAESGMSKTPAAKAAMEPADETERRMYHDYKRAFEVWGQRGQRGADDFTSEADTYAAGPAGSTGPTLGGNEPKYEQGIVSDATIEALVDVLRDNPRGTMLYVDELSGFFKGMDRYKSGGKGNERQHWLTLWSNGTLRVNRKGAGHTVINKPFVGIWGGIQPGILSLIKEGSEDGMEARWLLSYPQHRVREDMSLRVSFDTIKTIKTLYYSLRDLPVETDDYDVPKPSVVSMEQRAYEEFHRLRFQNKAELQAPTLPLALRPTWSKFEAYFARFVLILSQIRSPGTDTATMVDVWGAWQLLSYFKRQALLVHDVHGKPTEGETFAKALFKLIRAFGGEFEGPSGMILNLLDMPHKRKPEPNTLKRELKKLQLKYPSLSVADSHFGRGDSKRRTLIISTSHAGPADPKAYVSQIDNDGADPELAPPDPTLPKWGSWAAYLWPTYRIREWGQAWDDVVELCCRAELYHQGHEDTGDWVLLAPAVEERLRRIMEQPDLEELMQPR